MLDNGFRLMGAKGPAHPKQMNRLKETGFTRAVGAKKRCCTPRKANLDLGQIANTLDRYMLKHSMPSARLQAHRHDNIESLGLLISRLLRVLQ